MFGLFKNLRSAVNNVDFAVDELWINFWPKGKDDSNWLTILDF